MGFPRPFESDRDGVADGMNERHAWCIGTPEDLMEDIKRLDEGSGGFGGLLVQQVDWATREQVMHSFELIARYVKPQVQGSLIGLRNSQAAAERLADEVAAARNEATGQARARYDESRSTPAS
jgi:limonene 1,2-monooxygenase